MLRGGRPSCPSPAAASCTAGIRRAAGQALAELALVITVMLVMALAVFDLGMGFYMNMLLVQGARDGARVAADCSSTVAQIQAAALAAAPTGSTVTVTPNPRPVCPANNSVSTGTRVSVRYVHQWITPFWGGASSVTWTETAESR